MQYITVGDLKELLEDEADDRLVLVDVGYPPVLFSSRIKIQNALRNTHPIRSVDIENYEPILLEL